MDDFLKVQGSSFTMSEIEDKKRSFEANPSEPIEDSVLLLGTRMHRATDYKRRKVVRDLLKEQLYIIIRSNDYVRGLILGV